MVAWALLNLDRPDLLEDCELAGLLNLRTEGGFWSQGKAVRSLLLEAAALVLQGLDDIPAMQERKCLLDDVIQGKSLSQWSREHHRTREGVSKGMWRDICDWVADALDELALASIRRGA